MGNISQFENILWDYALLARDLQRLPAIGWIGEPKFQVDGTLFNGPWCRPQTDGPALGASLLIEFAFNYLEMGGSIEKVSTLYDSKLPTDSVIKTYLEYVSHYWNENTCDLVDFSR
jgi:glucoamylase